MSPQQASKKRKHFFLAYIWLLLILLTLLTVASYTWFALSRTPKVSDMNMYVTVGNGMEIALKHDSLIWGQQLDFADMCGNHAPLRPVTWSEQDQRFYAGVYGYDGRLTGRWDPLTDEQNANKNDENGYYCMGTFYARTDQPVNVSLAAAATSTDYHEGHGTYLIGTPVWNAETVSHDNAGVGAECAVRMGIRITPIDKEGNPTGKTPVFYIYEPNANVHLDGTRGYISTPSIDGPEHLVSEDRILAQTVTDWVEAYPVQRDVLIYKMGEFTGDTFLFRLETNEMVKIDLYIWLEGQDVDCTNMIQNAQILANFQLVAETGGQSGMVPIG